MSLLHHWQRSLDTMYKRLGQCFAKSARRKIIQPVSPWSVPSTPGVTWAKEVMKSTHNEVIYIEVLGGAQIETTDPAPEISWPALPRQGKSSSETGGQNSSYCPPAPAERTPGQRIFNWADAINYTGRDRLAGDSMSCLLLQLGRAIGNLLLNRLSLLRLCGLGLSLF
jgi:hypothetical protein